MNFTQHLITIAIIALGTMLTRFLPFVLFPGNRPTPKIISHLGDILPGAIFSLLVVYCLKNVELFSGTHGLPEAIAVTFVVLLHLWKRQMLLSIAGGAILYMVLVQTLF